MAFGHAEEVRDEAGRSATLAQLQEKWPEGEREHVVKVHPDVITGRRLQLEPDELVPFRGTRRGGMPTPVPRVEATAGDHERFDDHPRVAVGEDPGVGVETLTEAGSVRVDVVQCPARENRPTLSMDGIDAVDLERDLHLLVLELVARSGPQCDPVLARRFDEAIVDREHDREVVHDEREPPDRMLA